MKVVEEYVLDDKPTKYKVGDVINTKIQTVKEQGVINEIPVIITVIEVTNNKCVVEVEANTNDIGLLNFVTFNLNL